MTRRQKTLFLSAVVVLLLIAVGVGLNALWDVVRFERPVSAAATDSSEATIMATVLSIDFPKPQELIDASEDTLEAGRCLVVHIAVNRPVRGDLLIEDQSLKLLVHSPSQAFGVSRKGQEFELRLQRTSKPVEFVVAPGRSLDPSELPDTRHRRFTILTGPK